MFVARETTANASLISNKSILSVVIPAFFKTFEIESAGANGNSIGALAAADWATISTNGIKPNSKAFSSAITSKTAAPSLIFEEFAAVTIPFLSNAGRSFGILSNKTLPGSSSFSTRISSFLNFTGTLTISSSKRPSSWALIALLYDSTEKLSNSSLVK
ncbi:hypothetical protein BMS3Abin04_01766 [bacterium BMS3Abin04]|nr:hypothetical protein BMS3Abin04_01766 [bacterium BMS3Abin04]